MNKIINLAKTKPILVTIEERYANQRIDNFLIGRLKGLPKSRIYRIVRKGEVRVNKKRIKPDYRLQEGDEVRIPPMHLEPAATQKSAPSPGLQSLIEKSILYEDQGLIVINKPAGVAVHGGSGISFGVIEILRCVRPNEKVLELVHRLDRDTSGCLLIAKKASVLRELHELLRKGLLEKTYWALACGHWPKGLNLVDAPLRKNQLQSGERIVDVHQQGKAATTEFRVLQRFEDATLIEAKPQTGRTHQIRVHALYAKHPLVGDEKYGDKDFNKKFREYGCKRLFLHAYSLKFTLSSISQPLEITADLSLDLQGCLEQLKQA